MQDASKANRARRTKRAAAAMLLGLALAPVPAPGQIADSPEQVRPLLTGSRVPDVGLKGLDGNRLHLPSSVARRPTVLIFYRGSW